MWESKSRPQPALDRDPAPRETRVAGLKVDAKQNATDLREMSKDEPMRNHVGRVEAPLEPPTAMARRLTGVAVWSRRRWNVSAGSMHDAHLGFDIRCAVVASS